MTDSTDQHVASSRDPGSCLKVAQVLGRIGDKWTVLVMIMLAKRGYRFNELKREVDGISQRMLTLTLRNLERDGLVTRTVTPSIPPRVDYHLTDVGQSLAGPVRILGSWVLQNLDYIATSQAAYDSRPDGIQTQN